MGDTTEHSVNLRVSDAEREHVVALLTSATGRGLIDLAEFTARTDLALAARTRGDLNTLLLDLPGLAHADQPRSVPPPGSRLELREAGHGIRRRGDWQVPETLVLRPRTGTVDLDFGHARVDHREVRIELHGGATRVKLRFPLDATVDVEGLVTRRGKPSQVRDKGGLVGTGGAPHFVLTGRSASGQVVLLPSDPG
ncbi:DUF1707 SHOCT-like domain-containing protein [Actinophytocola oryzae]|nr:DUF1707 domain-containing protein [Actinophytocola oryzae]